MMLLMIVISITVYLATLFMEEWLPEGRYMWLVLRWGSMVLILWWLSGIFIKWKEGGE